jgi:hypothetical protein
MYIFQTIPQYNLAKIPADIIIQPCNPIVTYASDRLVTYSLSA